MQHINKHNKLNKMKAIKFVAVGMAAIMLSACSALQTTSNTTTNTASNNSVNIFDAGSVITANSTAANAGTTAGASLKNLYTTYKQQGKLPMNDLGTLISIAQLVNSCQNLKNSDATYKKAFGTGLVLGSTGLVTNQNSLSVTSALASTMTGVNTNTISSLLAGQQQTTTANNQATITSLLGALAGAAQQSQTGQQVTSTVSSAASTAAATANEVQNVSNSVTNILNLFK